MKSLAKLLFVTVLIILVLSGAKAQADYVLTDLGGRRIIITHPYKKIISLYGAHTENLFSLGLSDEIIGVSRNEAFPPEVLRKPVFSYHDDPEKFIGMRPDLVLIRPMIDRGYRPFVKKLEVAGITVVSLQPKSVTEMYNYWRDLGRLTGKEKQAEEMIKEFNRRINEIKKIVATIPKEKRKKVYFEAIHRRMKTFSPKSIAIFALETAGGINVARDAVAVKGTNIAFYGKEKILSHAAEIDVYLAQRGAMNHITIAKIKQEAGYGIIKAVRNNQIYIIDEKIVSRPTLRLADGIYEIGRILYPEKFNDVTNLLNIKKLNHAQYAEMFVKLFNIPIKTPDYYHDIKKRSGKVHKYGDFRDISYRGDVYKFAETMAYCGLLYNPDKYHFYPERYITRKEVAYSFFVIKDLPEVKDFKIKDVPETYSVYEQIKTVVGLGIMKLDRSGLFNPDGSVSGRELFEMVKKVKKLMLD
ncbi:MAG: hypothetical protein DRP08_02745 [Candidatus Aenigmatarchaeota archaeon]|nr:MAG: hypothetical protein DRP08_02745 [Candidatus Aenigmarchaeota archaeon]